MNEDKSPTDGTGLSHSNRVELVKDAIRLLMADRPIQRKGDVIVQIENHMTSTERGKHFFEVRQALSELLARGELIVFTATAPSGHQSTLLAVSGTVIRAEA